MASIATDLTFINCDITYPITNHAPIAQLDRVIGFEPIGREFESLWAHHSEIQNICYNSVGCMDTFHIIGSVIVSFRVYIERVFSFQKTINPATYQAE